MPEKSVAAFNLTEKECKDLNFASSSDFSSSDADLIFSFNNFAFGFTTTPARTEVRHMIPQAHHFKSIPSVLDARKLKRINVPHVYPTL